MSAADPTSFDERMGQWQAWAESPWGRIRFAVVQHTLGRTLAGAGVQRILDVGGGDGRDAVPLAECGHEVTIVDPSTEMLVRARERAAAAGVGERVRTIDGSVDDLGLRVGGGFDMVTCHFLVQYRADPAADVRRLVAALKPGGLLSLIAPNPAAYVVGKLVREGPAAALDELGADQIRAVTFDADVRKIADQEARAAIESAGCSVLAQYGGRCANDLLVDNEPKYDPAYFADLERLELALCDREPFNRLGAFWQLIARRTA